MGRPTPSLGRKASSPLRHASNDDFPGVAEHGTSALGLPKNLGDLPVSSLVVGRRTEYQTPGCSEPRSARCRANERARARYREVKETKRRGKGEQESEPPILPMKPGNPRPGDLVEGGGGRAAEPMEGKMAESLCSGSISTRLRRIAELARGQPQRIWTSAAHAIDLEWMREAYRRTRKNGAPGVDGQAAQEYAMDLDTRLRDLVKRFRDGTYRAPPVRRVHIPKGDGRELSDPLIS